MFACCLSLEADDFLSELWYHYFLLYKECHLSFQIMIIYVFNNQVCILLYLNYFDMYIIMLKALIIASWCFENYMRNNICKQFFLRSLYLNAAPSSERGYFSAWWNGTRWWMIIWGYISMLLLNILNNVQIVTIRKYYTISKSNWNIFICILYMYITLNLKYKIL